jgi:hypothetical protein
MKYIDMRVNISKNRLSENVNRRNWYLGQTWMWLTHSATVCVHLCVRARLCYTVRKELSPEIISFFGGREGGVNRNFLPEKVICLVLYPSCPDMA